MPTTNGRRGRPRASGQRSDVDAREEILRRAAALFSDRGIGATRMTDIAAAVGISAPSIYYHFGNLNAIVGVLLDYVIVESLAFATTVSTGPGTAAERLHQLIGQHVERLTLGPYDLWFVAGMNAGDVSRFPRVKRGATAWRRTVAGLVGEGIAAGTFDPIEPEVAVAAISGLVYGALELHHRGTAVDPDRIATIAVRGLSMPPIGPD